MENALPTLSFRRQREMLAAMQWGAARGVIKIWGYAAASVVLGAWAAPLVWNAGKALAEVSANKDINSPLEWLADRCRTAEFATFFTASLALAAAVLAMPFLRGVPARLAAWRTTRPLGRVPTGVQHAAAGFLLMTGVFLMLASALAATGVWPMEIQFSGKTILRSLAVAVAWAVVQEIAFRGVALGACLQAMRPRAALVASAVFFALVRLAIQPPSLRVADPDAAGTGFEMLGKLAARLADPQVLIGSFAPLLALGCVLASARLRTGSLWLPIGIHTGWILGNLVASSGNGGLPWAAIWFPIAVISLAGGLIMHLTHSTDGPTA